MHPMEAAKSCRIQKTPDTPMGGKADQGAVVLPVLFPLVEKDHREHGGHHKSTPSVLKGSTEPTTAPRPALATQ